MEASDPPGDERLMLRSAANRKIIAGDSGVDRRGCVLQR
jgi:hypothetical protein